MRSTSITVGLLTALALVAVPTAAMADTGGDVLYFAHAQRTHAYRAPVADLARRTALAVPAAAAGGRVDSVVPSPDGRWVAQAWQQIDVKGGGTATRVIVTDRNGRHARTVWSRHDADDRAGTTQWRVADLTWAGRAGSGAEVFFSAVRYYSAEEDPGWTSTSKPMTALISRDGRPARPTEVPGTAGLGAFAVDPATGTFAAVRVDNSDCYEDSPGTTTSTIVLLNAHTGVRRDLATVTTPRFRADDCAKPPYQLSWSPDGTQVAFVQPSCCAGPHYLNVSEIDVVAADGSDGGGYRVAVAYDRRHLVTSPTWRDAHSLWFQREILDDGATDDGLHRPADLYSVGYRHGRFGPLVRRTHTPKVAEASPSFG
jgi:hypothetical protein